MKKKLQLKLKQTATLRAGRALLGMTPCLLATASFLNAQTSEGTATTPAPNEEIVVLDEMTVETNDDPNMVLSTQPIQAAIGFSKSLIETPRSVSSVGADLVDKIGIRDGDQLSRIVPGTYTVNRWGIAGATQIRGLPADTYLRGMKRIDAQGNIRNVITMWENVDIVRGPPSPIFGNGRIGGYVNYTPKSVRGTTGKYLDKSQTSVTAVVASYDRVEAQFNYAQPITLGERTGGFQVFGLVNDSDSYFKQNFQKDRVLQASFSLDLNSKWRVETGTIYQRAINAGQAGANRVDQASFDNGTYLRGSALVDLDTDNDGRVSEREIQASRTVGTGNGIGNFTGARPLSVNYGSIARIRGENTIIGAPQRLINLLLSGDYAAAAASDAGAAIIAAGPLRYADGSPADAFINSLNSTPAGFFLDPSQLEFVPRDWSLVAIEEKADGNTFTGYLDFVSDLNADATDKLQLFYDYQEQQKESQLPFNQEQQIAVFESKYTGTRHASELPVLEKLPEWIDWNLLASVNARYSDAWRRSTSGDYDHRRDLVRGYTPTDTFASFIRTGDESFATGEPVSSDVHSTYWEAGMGFMSDITLFERLNIIPGVRKDWIDVKTRDGRVYPRTTTAAATGTVFTPPRFRNGSDDATSKSISVLYKTPFAGFTPYYTTAKSSSALTGTFQEINYSNVNTRAILSEASLEEAGFKGKFLDEKAQYSVSFFDQVRTGNVIVEGESYNRSTRNEGAEIELRYAPNRNWSFILSATYMIINRVGLDPAGTRPAAVSANYLGISDIRDAGGNIVVPANAYLYGGNAAVNIPNRDRDYDRFGQYPEWVLGSFVGYNWDNGWNVSWSANRVDSVAASSEIPDLLILPSYLTHNFSVAYDNKTWRFGLTVRNAFDEEYFVPNNGSFGGQLLQPGLPTNYELSVTRRF
jgi:outer membrane receptor protein involved in Fe transport